MKFIIAFAFVAMASAVSIEPVELPEPQAPQYEIPDISPLMVPVEVMEAVRQAELTGVPLDVSHAVNFVDAPIAEDGTAVRFVDVAFNIEAANAADFPAESLNFAEIPDEEVQPAQDGAVADDEVMAVKVVDAPLEDAEPLVDDATLVDDFAIRIVDAPLPVEEEVIQHETVRVVEPIINEAPRYADPRLRGGF